MAVPLKANVINHVAFVLDRSSSMQKHARDVVKVADAEIAHLAGRSKEMGQETRVSIYTFSYASEIKCVIFDMDVLRLPSIAELYQTGGMTALASATTLVIEDLGQTFQKYGDHAFLQYVLTDGIENDSPYAARVNLPRKISSLPENWTLALLVPNQSGVAYATNLGVPKDNVAVWNADMVGGFTEVGSVLREATERFMQGRAKGIRGSRSVFSTGAEAVNAETIQQAALKPLPHSAYKLVPVPEKSVIRPFVESCGFHYTVGMAYYQLTKRETIQARKKIAIVHRKTDKVYVGDGVRDMLGLPVMETRVSPEFNPDYDIYVESTSVNRNLLPSTKLLILSGR